MKAADLDGKLHFRVVGKLANVLELQFNQQTQRSSFAHLANVRLNDGKIIPKNGADIDCDLERRVNAWYQARRQYEKDEISHGLERAIEYLGQLTDIILNKAESDQLFAVEDRLTLAQLDLRIALTKRLLDLQKAQS